MKNARLRQPPSLGFTLLELLVAITVLAFVSIIAWRGLETLVAARERLEPERDEARAMLTTFGQIERDLAQAMANPYMFALDAPPVSAQVIDGGQVLLITRTAQTTDNPATAMQVVRYRVAEGILLREATAPTRVRGQQLGELSSSSSSPGLSQPTDDEIKNQITTARLLGNVKNIKLRFWQPTAQNWMEPNFDAGTALTAGTPDAGFTPAAPGAPVLPGVAGAGAFGGSNLPTGVEITVERTDGKMYRRVALVG